MLVMNIRVLETHYVPGCSTWEEMEGLLYYQGVRRWLIAFRGTLWILENTIQDDFFRGYPWLDCAVSRPTFEFSWHHSGIPPVVWFRRYVFTQTGLTRFRCMVGCMVVPVTHLILRLQEWFRLKIARRRSRCLALCMAFHPRLGRDSPLSVLDQDLVRVLVLGGGRDGSGNVSTRT
jgi:hypothetical protein